MSCLLHRRQLLALGGLSLPLLGRARTYAPAGLPALPAGPAEPALSLRTASQAGAPAKYAPVDLRYPGLCAELRQAVERVDPGLRFSGQDHLLPLRRVERMLSQQEIDVFFCLIRSAERARQWDYLPVPLYRVRHRVVLRVEDGHEILGWPELRALSLGKPVLVAQGSVLAQTLAQAQVSYSEAPRSDAEALRMLLLGRADAVYVQDMSVAPLLAMSEFAGRLRLAEPVFQEDEQWVAVSRGLSPAARQRLVRALQTLEREGRLRTLAERYRIRSAASL
jgi:ABC-type amino acid transport substrate-binding protein